jgi:hypothetical protein
MSAERRKRERERRERAGGVTAGAVSVPRYNDGTAVQLGDAVHNGAGRGQWRVESVKWHDYTQRGGQAWWGAVLVSDTGKRPQHKGAAVSDLRRVAEVAG